MSQRISDKQLKRLSADLKMRPELAASIRTEIVTATILDLKDARAENTTLKARIAELERLSASQIEPKEVK